MFTTLLKVNAGSATKTNKKMRLEELVKIIKDTIKEKDP